MAEASRSVGLPVAGRDLRVEITGSMTDDGVVGVIEQTGDYEPHIAAVLAHTLRDDGISLDIGANIGALTCVMAALSPAGHVYAFEPARRNLQFLHHNLAANGFTDRVTVVEAAVYSRAGSHTLSLPLEHPAGAHVSERAAIEGDHQIVTLLTIDEWVAEHELERIDLLKVDIEGAELRMLDGAATTIERFRPIVLMECNPVALRRFHGATADDLLQRLRALLPFVGLVQGDGTIRPVDDVATLHDALATSGIVDLVAAPRERVEMLVREEPVPTRRRAKQWVKSLVGQGDADVPVDLATPRFSYAPSGEISSDTTTVVGAPGATVTIGLTLRNDGDVAWSSEWTRHAVRVGARWHRGHARWESVNRADLAGRVEQASSATATLQLVLPDEPGAYRLEVALIQEDYAWFSDLEPDFSLSLAATVG